MSYKLISFDEINSDYNGRDIELRTSAKGLAKIKVLEVAKGVDTVSIKYSFISGDASKFQPKMGSVAVLARSKINWSNPAKYWLPYLQLASSKSCLPENNDGRDTCRFCGSPTRRCGGWSSMTDYRVCKSCGR